METKYRKLNKHAKRIIITVLLGTTVLNCNVSVTAVSLIPWSRYIIDFDFWISIRNYETTRDNLSLRRYREHYQCTLEFKGERIKIY